MRRMAVTVCLALALCILAAGQDKPSANPKDELSKIPWLKDTARRADRVWQTKYDISKPETAYPTRIVSYAGKWTRHSFGGHGGLASNCSWRYANSPLVPKKTWQEIGQLILNEADVDGDGDKKDDFIFSLLFSMEVPLSIPDWPAACVFPERLSSTFYGGATYYCANNKPDNLSNFSGEMGVNPDHNSPFFDSRAEDHPINGMRHKTLPNSFLRHYVVMLWKKDDFLNSGGRFRVSFDDASRVAVLLTRAYWYGWNDVRYVVKNKEQFYISEIIEPVPDYAFKDASKLKKPSGYLPVCRPTKTKWAAYKPQGYHIKFDPNDAAFEAVKFDDVQAVGWYIAKTDSSSAQTHCKWYGFEADAVVHSPAEPSPNLEMATLSGKKTVDGKDIPPFNIATCELPYAMWQNIYRWGDSPHHVLQARYIYAKSGSMGSMGYGKRQHEHDEPLTDITFYDALALCNTLSEMEGKTPCYYTDAECKEIFKNRHIATYATLGKDDAEQTQLRHSSNPEYEIKPVPKIYVKWQADGHRLPTPAEWTAGLGGQKPQPQEGKGDGTKPVGAGKPNENSLYDMIGNIWELCWTFGNVYDPEADPPVAVLGGDFNYPKSPVDEPASPYGDTPYKGDPRIGLRLLCRDAGLPAPPMGIADAKRGVYMNDLPPRWSFGKDELAGKKADAKPVAKALLDMADLPGGTFVRHDRKTVKVAPFAISKYTVTFDRWKTVRQWAQANGYEFYRNGDMGSMFFFDFTHSPDEPVTNITWFDMITWCNALSEMEGKTPCYYEDEACTKIIRKAFAFRPIKLDGYQYIQVDPPMARYQDGRYAKPFIVTRWDVDGYRLPTAAEMDFAIRGGTKTTYFWGDNVKDGQDYVWDAGNSHGRTHPVGLKKPNPYGLFDIQGNVKEWLFSGDGQDDDRPYDRDLDNPIASPFYGYKKPPEVNAPIKNAILAGGPGFLYGGANVNQHGVGVESAGASDLTHYYSDVSFRPVQCAAGTHPRDGLRPLAVEEVVKKMITNKEKFNDLGK
ncbi:MAG: SUMF1/EgtB/PvdO family nonheme iron enzyme [Planctomycetes bacterium]|nr:SUMF1/EgtB/PvdO family nonheme iron enzyme [Planctomycetota bacterium]